MLDRESSIWAIRFFLGREPANDAEVQLHCNYADLESLRRAFSQTGEFQEFLKSINRRATYCAPLFLLDPPSSPRVLAQFTPPSLTNPTSQLCTQAQMTDPAYSEWCRALELRPMMHRKYWEFAYILAVMQKAGMLVPGRRALAFGVGTEPLPSYLASRGMSVMATDAPPEAIAGHGWESTGQHAHELEQLFYPGLISRSAFKDLVSYRAADMNDIATDLRYFDVCWSACCFEHLGSLQKGLDFIVNTLETLRPGGISVHTTEFNLTSNNDTLELPNLSIFRKRDIEALIDRLVEAGHYVWPLNLHPGAGALDEHIDLPPFAEPHLKLQLSQYTCTSIGIVVRKRMDAGL